MALIVHKYGGTSMGSVERIKNVAKRVAKWHKAGHKMVVVPSAMSGETNRLLGLAKEISPQPSPRELDMIASTGEQVSVGLLSIALQEAGVDAIMSSSRGLGWLEISFARPSRRFVSPDIAEGTTTILWPALCHFATRFATFLMRSTEPIDVPPYLCTMSAIVVLN